MGEPKSRAMPCQEDGALHQFMMADPARQVQMLRAWRLPEAVAVVVVNACANQCFFCAQPGTISVRPDDITPWARIEAQLGGPRPPEVTRLMIGGNEPTLHPEFERLMAGAAPAGFTEIDLMTSGMALADEANLTRWIGQGLSSVAVPLYAADAALHDEITGAVCFDTITAGLDAAHARGVTIHVHALALKRSRPRLAALARMVSDRWGATLAIAPLRDKDGLFDWDAEAMTLAQMRQWLVEEGRGLPISLLGWPSCVDRAVPAGSAQVIEMYFRTQLRRFAQVCEGCADRPTCLGVVQALLERMEPAEALVPRHDARQTSRPAAPAGQLKSKNGT